MRKFHSLLFELEFINHALTACSRAIQRRDAALKNYPRLQTPESHISFIPPPNRAKYILNNTKYILSNESC